MRIKCPNSDIFLELPGDRTDMKFTCPACHKVHRVTVSITTPGEDPQPGPNANTRSMTRSQPTLPKKYATGAYPPVVDIPIDANFILLDGSAEREGVDLGAAAPTPPPEMDDDIYGRRTEIIRDEPIVTPPPNPEPAEADAVRENMEDAVAQPGGEAANGPDAGEPETVSDGRAMWDEVDGGRTAPDKRPGDSTPAADEAETVMADVDEEPRPRAPRSRRGTIAKRRKGRAGAGLWIIVVIACAAAGFLGWQQFRYNEHRDAAVMAVDWAETAWEKGDGAAAAAHVRDAETALRQAGDCLTPGALWNRVRHWLGAGEGEAAKDDLEKRIDANLERVRTLRQFDTSLDPASVTQMAGILRDAGLHAAEYAVLSRAMQTAVVDRAVRQLESEALPPEVLAARAAADRDALSSALPPDIRSDFERRVGEFIKKQKARFAEETRQATADIAAAADAGDAEALNRYLVLAKRLANARHMDPPANVSVMALDDERATIEQLARLAEDLELARASAQSILSRPDGNEADIEGLIKRAEEDVHPNPILAERAVALIDATRAQADDLLRLRAEVFGRVQSELRRGRNYPGTRMAWAMLRLGFDDPKVRIDPAGFRFDTNRARMECVFDDVPVILEMNEDDYETRIRATVNGYRFTAGWAFLMHKPLSWMADLARGMRTAGVSPERHPDWELLEGPGAPLALTTPVVASAAALGAVDAGVPARHIFYDGVLRRVDELPLGEDARKVVDDFRDAARELHDRVLAADSIPQTLRQALRPVLMGTYQQPDPRDYFDSAFCRRLIEADYLESFIKPMPSAVQEALEQYRLTLGRLEAGYDDFRVMLEGGGTLYAVARLDADITGDGRASDQDPETGETIQRYTWRLETPARTVFYSPLPARFVYAFLLAEHYDGAHKSRPAGVPELTEVWHVTQGLVASYEKGAAKAMGDSALWDKAIAQDISGRYDPSSGPPGWNYPLHVLERDDQGDPVTLATLSGIVKSPDFSGIRDEVMRRRAENDWLDTTAATLSTPGELGLIFHQFFRYCSDSPLPELPNLIGSHYGLSDTHQTVYQSLERRWVGRLIGDCDDLAEFFQVLTRRQGKLSHVMQLPGHAACGYIERTSDDNYRFIVLQTGPVLQFNAASLNEVVETAYRSFDRGEGISHMTTDAVPLLLRFADEETRTPFVLSARIYEDPDYAETMIQVQAYWHEHVYSSAIEVMEEMVAEDQEIGNIKELGSLYERVGFYDKSAEMRYRELEMVKDQPQAALSTLLEIVQLHFQEKNKPRALEALGQMEARMKKMIDDDDAGEYFRAITFRSYWAIFLSRLEQPDRAWDLVRYDALMTKRQLGRIAEPVLRTLVIMYERMCMMRDSGKPVTANFEKAMTEVREELDEAFGRGYFKSDDSYNNIIMRYYILGRFAISDIGREDGLERIMEDGPYADKAKDQTRRTRSLSDEDWSWFRITPQLYLSLGLEMLDREEYPELYDPAAAKPILEDVARAVEKGTGLGSDVAGGDDAIKADMTLSFLNRDLDAFRRCLEIVKEKDYASLYDEAALVLGLLGGFIPEEDFPDWIEVFREFFPGSQHYFKVVYRAIDKENYDHALIMAEATARFFPDDELLGKEAEFVRSIIPGLKLRKQNRELMERHGVGDASEEVEPAA